jgi:hypothetical protein
LGGRDEEKGDALLPMTMRTLETARGGCGGAMVNPSEAGADESRDGIGRVRSGVVADLACVLC